MQFNYDDNEEEIITKYYVFMLRRHLDKNNLLKSTLCIDSFTEILSPEDVIFAQLSEDLESTNEHLSMLKSMKLRARHNNDILPNFYKVNCNFDLDIESLQLYIDALDQDEVMKFLNKAKAK